MAELNLRVRARKHEADGICSFELEPLDGAELPPFTAGAHIDVHVGPGLVRQYSLCGDPHERRFWRIGVLREPMSRGGSAGMHDRVAVGQVIQVGAPRNLFPLADASHSVLVAGGIGVTPILAMARHLQRTGGSFELHYCARTRQRMAFVDDILAGAFADRARIYLDEPGAGSFDASQALSETPPHAHLYVCGPAGFMEYVLASARSSGWTEDRLHREHFASAPVDAAGDRPFQMVLNRSGATLDVPAGMSALKVLLDHGVDVPYSCEAGVCGSCVTPVLEGTPDHRDTCLMDDERAANNVFTPCCSRARTPTLVLDL
jgi:vanillate O-demethylase ferredoxin subunit